MDCLGRPYHFKYSKGCLPQLLLGQFLNNLTQMKLNRSSWVTFSQNYLQGQNKIMNGYLLFKKSRCWNVAKTKINKVPFNISLQHATKLFFSQSIFRNTRVWFNFDLTAAQLTLNVCPHGWTRKKIFHSISPKTSIISIFLLFYLTEKYQICI